MREDRTNSNAGEEHIGHLGIVNRLAKIRDDIEGTLLYLAAKSDLNVRLNE